MIYLIAGIALAVALAYPCGYLVEVAREHIRARHLRRTLRR
jgi:hypothetical protein